MTTLETPNNPEDHQRTDVFKNSPLGQDPEEIIEDLPENNEPPPSDDSGDDDDDSSTIQLTREEYDLLKEKERSYDVVTSDEKAISFLQEHFSKGGLADDDDGDDNMTPGNDTEYGQQIGELKNIIKNMAQTIQSTQETLAGFALERFEQKNPDFTQHRETVGRLMQEIPGLNLEQALRIAKSEAGPPSSAQNSQRRDVATRPTVETSGGGDVPGVGDRLQDVERDIADSKKVPDFEQAVKMALRTAKRVHGV